MALRRLAPLLALLACETPQAHPRRVVVTAAVVPAELQDTGFTEELRLEHPSHPGVEGAPHVIVHASGTFDPRAPYAAVVFLHGWSGCVRVLVSPGEDVHCSERSEPQRGWDLAGTFDAVEVNAVLMVPQLAYRKRDGTAGHFADEGFAPRWLDEVREALDDRLPAPPAWIVLVAHSAGYESALAWIAHADVDAVALMDALYAGTEPFAEWARRDAGHWLVSITTGGSTGRQSRRLQRIAEAAGLSVSVDGLEERVSVVHTRERHAEVPSAYMAQVLRALLDDREGFLRRRKRGETSPEAQAPQDTGDVREDP